MSASTLGTWIDAHLNFIIVVVCLLWVVPLLNAFQRQAIPSLPSTSLWPGARFYSSFVAVAFTIVFVQSLVHAIECVRSERRGRLRSQMRRHTVRGRPGVALPHAKRWRVGFRGDPLPRLRVGAELLQRAPRVGLRPQEKAAPLDLDRCAELLFQPTQPHGRVEAPRSEIVGVGDQTQRGHAHSSRSSIVIGAQAMRAPELPDGSVL